MRSMRASKFFAARGAARVFARRRVVRALRRNNESPGTTIVNADVGYIFGTAQYSSFRAASLVLIPDLCMNCVDSAPSTSSFSSRYHTASEACYVGSLRRQHLSIYPTAETHAASLLRPRFHARHPPSRGTPPIFLMLDATLRVQVYSGAGFIRCTIWVRRSNRKLHLICRVSRFSEFSRACVWCFASF